MSKFDDDFRFAECVHRVILGPLYAALSYSEVTVERLPYNDKFPFRGDVVIRRPGYADLYIEEKASRPLPDGLHHAHFLLDMSAPGEPSLRSLRHNDVMVFALCDTLYVDVYFLGAKALSDWIFLNAKRCLVRRLFFPGRKDVIVLKIPIALVIQDLGTSARLYRVNLGGRMAGMFGVWGFG
jgi:hypothetical protein